MRVFRRHKTILSESRDVAKRKKDSMTAIFPLYCKNILQNKNRQRPTFPGSFPPSIIGAKELNYCVRDGNRCDLLAIVTGFSACGFSIWLCCCSHPAVLMYLCTLRSSVLARLVSCKISCAVSCLRIFLRNFSAFELLLSQNLLRSFNILYPEN